MAPRKYMRTDRSRFPALRACRCPARPTLLGWKSVVTPKGRMTGAAVSATPTPCMHRTLHTCSILVRPDSESNMPALFDGLSTCSAHTHHLNPIRATIWRLVCRRSSNTLQPSSRCAWLAWPCTAKSLLPEAPSSFASRALQGAGRRCGHRFPLPLSTLLLFSITLRPSPCPA